MTYDLDGQVVLVTGANRGIGRGYALFLADLGATVIINSTGRDDSGAALAKSINADGGKALDLPIDACEGERVVRETLEKAGGLHAIVHNAGIVRDKAFHKLSPEDWETVYRVNLESAFALCHAAWPHFRAQEFGRVVLTSSASGLYGNFGQANYGAAKAGLIGLCRTLAIEGRRYNIMTNCLAPIGLSDMNRAHVREDRKPRIDPKRVAPLVAWLCHAQCEENGSLFEAAAGNFKKVRWERNAGLRFADEHEITLQDIADNWDSLTDFGSVEHPRDIGEAVDSLMGDAKQPG